MTGVVKEFPVSSDVPPFGAAYQLIVPVEADAPNIRTPGPQRAAGVTPVIEGVTLMVAVTAVLVDVHIPIVASTQ